MSKRFSLIIIVIFLFNFNVFANAQLKDGWHMLPSATKKNQKVWAYYKNGVEKIRFKKMIYV